MSFRVLASWSAKRSPCANAETPEEFLAAVRRAAVAVDLEVDPVMEGTVQRLWQNRKTALFAPVVARDLNRRQADQVVNLLCESGIKASKVWDMPVFYMLRTVRFRPLQMVIAQNLFLLLMMVSVVGAALAGSRMPDAAGINVSAVIFTALYILFDVLNWRNDRPLGTPSLATAPEWDGERLSIRRDRGPSKLDIFTLVVCMVGGGAFIVWMLDAWWGLLLVIVGILAGLWGYEREKRSTGFHLEADDEHWRMVVAPLSPDRREFSGRTEDIIAVDRKAVVKGDTNTPMRIHRREGEPIELGVSTKEWTLIALWRDRLAGYTPRHDSPEAGDLPRLAEPFYLSMFGRTHVMPGNDDFSFALVRRATQVDPGYGILSMTADGHFVVTTYEAAKKDIDPELGLALEATRDLEADAATHRRAFEMLYGEHLQISADEVPDVPEDVLGHVLTSRALQVVVFFFLLSGAAFLLGAILST